MSIERAAPLPQQRRAVERRAACVDAARRIMLTDGAHSLTMHTASVAAGGSKAAIYRYFTDRSDLIDAVVSADRERLEALFERYSDAVAAPAEFDIVCGAVRAMVDPRLSTSGCVPMSTNSLGRSRDRDHVSRYAWRIAARVHLSTDAGFTSVRIGRYSYIVAAVDAILVRARRHASAGEKKRLMQLCFGVVVAVLGGADAV